MTTNNQTHQEPRRPGATDSSPLCDRCFPQGSWDSHPVRLCPLHASAPALLAALEAATVTLYKAGRDYASSEILDAARAARNAIEEATSAS